MKRILPYLALLFSATGCVYDRGDCPPADIPDGLKLDFTFTNNKQGENLLSGRINDVRIYFFDQNRDSLLTHVIDVSPEDILDGEVVADVPSGLYTIVSWGSNSDDMMTDGFRAAQAGDIDGDGRDEYIDPKRGTTTFDDFRMMLSYEDVPEGETGEVTPTITHFDDLYFASESDVLIDRTKNQTLNFDFIRNTSVFNVAVSGLQHLPATRADADPASPIDVFVTSANGIYQNDNTADSQAQQMRYNPYDETMQADSLNTKIKSLRLDMNDDCGATLCLHLSSDHSAVVAPMSLMSVIKATCDHDGNTVYNTQEDIDREDEFLIEVTLGDDLSVSVSVNDFEPIVLTPEQSDAEDTPNKPNKTK